MLINIMREENVLGAVIKFIVRANILALFKYCKFRGKIFNIRLSVRIHLKVNGELMYYNYKN